MPLSHEISELRNELRDLRDDVRDIGEKVAKTDVLVSTLADALRQERAGAATYRQQMRETVAGLVQQQDRTVATVSALAGDFNEVREQTRQHYTDLTQVIAALSGAVKTLAEKVAEMKPTVDAVVIEKHELAGKQKLLKRQWALVAAIGAFFAWLIGEAAGWWPALWSAIQSRGKP